MSAIDWERSACLCRAGEPDYVAAVCVTDTGEEVLWLVNVPVLEGIRSHDATHGDADQPHEGLGRLPEHIQGRLQAVARSAQDAAVLPEIIAMREGGHTFAAIARHLNETGSRTTTGKPWYPQLVRARYHYGVKRVAR